MKLDEVIKIIRPETRGLKSFRRNFYEARIGEASGKGKTLDEAVDDLKKTVKQAFDGDYLPTIISFRGLTGIVWRELQCWYYKILEAGDLSSGTQKKLWGCTVYESETEAMKRLRSHLADLAHDEEEETSPIILDEEDQERFGKAWRWQKRFQVLKATGMEDEAIRRQIWDEEYS